MHTADIKILDYIAIQIETAKPLTCSKRGFRFREAQHKLWVSFVRLVQNNPIKSETAST